jgi:hypothetical protein
MSDPTFDSALPPILSNVVATHLLAGTVAQEAWALPRAAADPYNRYHLRYDSMVQISSCGAQHSLNSLASPYGVVFPLHHIAISLGVPVAKRDQWTMKNKVLNITDTMLAPQPLRLIKIYCKNVRERLSIAQHTKVHFTKTDFQLQEDYRTVIVGHAFAHFHTADCFSQTGASTAISDNLFTFDMAVWIPCCGAQCQLDGCVYDLVPLIHYIAVSFEASVVKRHKLVRGNGALNIDGTMPAFQSLYLFTTHGEILQGHLEYIEVQKTNSWVQEDNKANTLIMVCYIFASFPTADL